ncbi:LamG-like jellyroll fold domain-containing protein [Flavicella sediminum]|uniref:LamG-like jellyroll fold domain-containing protein n=1 Tax=Flavicella sediminum TaxID=2585141 RepID=UPI001123D6B4|nr:LamG-like jellyroll fold domain-containing protein [Flavicella sediminum]
MIFTKHSIFNKIIKASIFLAAYIIQYSAISQTTIASEDWSTANYSSGSGWTGDWIETDDDNNSGTGLISINAGSLLMTGDASSSNDSANLRRKVNLTGYSTPTLNFTFSCSGAMETNDFVWVEYSTDNGSSWTTLDTFQGESASGGNLLMCPSGGNSGSYEEVLPSSGGANTFIRFRSTISYDDELFRIDNIEIIDAFVSTGDNDGDGIDDAIDLDDDNDGILDSVEQNYTTNTILSCDGVDQLVFENSIEETGDGDSNFELNEVYRFPNVLSGVDVLVTISALNNITLLNIDDDGSYASSIIARTNPSISGVGTQAYVEYTFNFVTSGTTTPYQVSDFNASFNDIDGNNNFSEQSWSLSPSVYTYNGDTELTFSRDGNWFIGTSGNTEYGGVSNENPQVNFTTIHASNTEYKVRFGFISNISGTVNTGNRETALDFTCNSFYTDAYIGHIDTDGDGIPNYQDLDSDNDGIPDNIEAQSTAGYIAPNNVYDGSGVDTAYSGGLTPVNSDGAADEVDYLDLDSDNDGLSDTLEAGLTLSGTQGTNGLDNSYDNGDTYTDVNGSFDNTQTDNFPDEDEDVLTQGDVDYRDDTINNDNDDDNVNDETDLDDDNDGITDLEELGTCSTYDSSIDWTTLYTNGTTSVSSGDDPVLSSEIVTINNIQVTLSRFTPITTSTNYNINDNLTSDSSYNLSQAAAQNGSSTHTFSFDTPIHNLSFTLHDIDLNTNSKDNVELVFIDFKGDLYTMSGADYTVGTDNVKVVTPSTNVFEGTDAAIAGATSGNITINGLPIWISKFKIIFTNTDTTDPSGTHDMAIGDISFCLPADTDGDGVFNFRDLDSDNDGILDNIEAQTTSGYIAPNNEYSATGIDTAYGTGLSPNDFDNDGIDNYLDLDADNDGIPDNIESQTTQGYIAPSGSFDIFGIDLAYSGGNTPVNTDETDNTDYLDLDSDNDGIYDIVESGSGLTDTSGGADGKTDGNVGTNGLDNTLDNGDTFADINGIFDENFTSVLNDSDGDVNASGGDLDYRDAVVGNDTDNDGIPNDVDIDDDNDGILDTDENNNCLSNSVGGYDAYWTYENSTDDISGNSNDLQNSPAGLAYSTNSISGANSVLFDGTYFLHYSQSSTFLEQTIANFTYSFWINPSSVTGIQFLVDEGGSTNGISIRLNGDVLEAQVKEGNGTEVSLNTASLDLIEIGNWYHIAFVYSNGNATLYLNGTATPELATGFGSLNTHVNNSGFGGSNSSNAYGTSGADYFTGLMDEFLHYPTALNSTDIGELYSTPNCDTDGDGIPNHLDIDSDNDGIPDNVEGQSTTAFVIPTGSVGANGLYNVYENNDTSSATSFSIENTDGVDNPDYLDLDSDNDTTPDIQENGDADNVASGIDTDGDGLDDNFEGSNTNDGFISNDEINDPATDLPDVDSDVTTTGDVDYRDAVIDDVEPNVVGNTLWLRADKGVTGGSAVTLWEDQTEEQPASTVDFIGSGGNEPSSTANTLNFNPVITFTPANNDVLTYTGNLNPVSMYIVYNDVSTANRTSAFTNNDGNGIGYGDNSTNVYDLTNTPAIVTGGNQFVNGLSTTLTAHPRPDNFELITNIFTGEISNASHTYYVGKDRTQASSTIEGSVAEVMLFSTQHSFAKKQQVESYLAIKYGFTLDKTDNEGSIIEGDYILSDLTTKVWNYTNNSAYHYDVAGIGRDDGMVLLQKQSKSQNQDAEVHVTIGLGNIVDTNNNNSGTFANNKDFLVWGNNNSSLTTTTSSVLVCAPEKTLTRVWKVKETGTVGSVQVAFDAATINGLLNTPFTTKLLKVADDAIFSSNVQYIPITSTTVNGSTQYVANYNFDGTKYFTYTEVNGIFWNGDSNSWTGGAGTANSASTQADDVDKVVVVDSQGTSNHATLDENAVVECVWVKENSKLTITDNHYLEFDEDFILDGEIRMIGDAQLIQTHLLATNVEGTGKIYIDQQASVPNVYRYHYWSSPVVEVGKSTFSVGAVMKDGTVPTSENSQPLDINFTTGFDGDFSTSPITLSNYWIWTYTNGVSRDDWVQKRDNVSIQRAAGYTMKSTGIANQNYTFVGKPNDGTITIPVDVDTNNLIGNPYPCALDAIDFLNENSEVLEGTLYFWQHKGEASTSNVIAGHHKEGYQGGYATTNLMMSVAAQSIVAGTDGLGSGNTYDVPGRYIAVGQSFFAGAKANGTITFENAHRNYQAQDNSNSVFFKGKKNKIKPTSESSTNAQASMKLGFEYTNENNVAIHRQLGIGFDKDFTFAYDEGYDSAMYDLQETDAYIHFTDDTNKYSIAAVPQINDAMEIPLGISTNSDQNVKLILDEANNLERTVYLKDNILGTYQAITGTAYEFFLEEGTYENRFSIVFQEGQTLETINPTVETREGIKVHYDKKLQVLKIINPENLQISASTLINMSGIRFNTAPINSENNRISVKHMAYGIYVLKLQTNKGTVSQKIIIY